MLIKLIKHDFRCTGRIILPMLGAVLLLSVMAGVLRRLVDTYQSVWWVIRIVSYLITFAFGAGLFAICVVAAVMMIQRFYKSLMGDEGYISFTLPVTVDSHIFSKLITFTVWFAAILIMCILSVCICFTLAKSNAVALDLPGLFASMNKHFGMGNTIGYSVECFAIAVLASFSLCLHFYSAVAVGCSSGKSKKLLSVVAFFVLSIVRNAVAFFCGVKAMSFVSSRMMFCSINAMEEYVGYMHAGFGAICICLLALSAVYYFITRYFLKNKLNLA